MGAQLKRRPRRENSDTTTILNAIRHIVRALRESSRRAEKEIGLSGAQLFVLQKLREHPGASQNDLAVFTATHPSSVSVVVQRLHRRGLISRRPSSDDSRRAVLRLTTEGHAAVRRRPAVIQDQLITAVSTLSAVDRRLLASILERVVATMELVGSRPPMFFEDGDLPAVSRGRAER